MVWCKRPRDREARCVYYSGSNHDPSPNSPTDPNQHRAPKGKVVYGYRSLPLQLADAERRFSVILAAHVQPANLPEAEPPAALLESLPDALPFIHIDAVAGDAAFGYPVFLLTIYRLGARRLVDLRAHATDKDKSLWPVRGYDDRGRPVCPWGYALCSNGSDRERQRHKWICCQACRHEKERLVALPGVANPPTEPPLPL